ncbi:MAG: hypothetical protein ACWA5P_02065 [bacterium]
MGNTVFFQPKGINPKYCEIGMFLDSDPDYIHYLNEPCKIHVNEVKIIEKHRVKYDKKRRLHYINKFKNMEDTNNKSLLKFIFDQMDKLDKGNISIEKAKAQSNLARQANNALNYELNKTKVLMKVDQYNRANNSNIKI